MLEAFARLSQNNQAEAEKLPAWMLDARQKGELALLMNGALAPLRGYMSQAEHSAVPSGSSVGS